MNLQFKARTTAQPKWKQRLAVEKEYVRELEALERPSLLELAAGFDPLSANHDTSISLDWPHYCVYATEACGGPRGWCYTFAGFHVTRAQARKVAMNDVLSRRAPEFFSHLVVSKVGEHVQARRLPYPNIRYSGSGELTSAHLPALREIAARGVRPWGFTKNPQVAIELHGAGISVLFSVDHTTAESHLRDVKASGVRIAYSSRSVEDVPPTGTLVTFPVHVSGRVAEVVDDSSLCPKVVEEFMHGTRTPEWCQLRCHRCHTPATASSKQSL